MERVGADSGLHVPDVPKLELDQLTDQLVDPAHGGERAQGRLRALLRAIDSITGELSVRAVLRNTVEAACGLVSARYAALGTISADGSLDEFIPVGLDADVGIAYPRDGNGLLGALISDPRPIRLASLADDPRSAGFAAGHPPMQSFLGVSIQVRGTVFGYLYLIDGKTGAFTAEDEQLVFALAQAAGAAICVALCYDESQLQQRWLSASAEISAALLAGHDEHPLQLVAQRAVELADADAASLSLTADPHDALIVKVAIGADTDALVGQRFPWGETLGGLAVQMGEPLLRTADSAERPSLLASVFDTGPVMALPLQGTGGIRGVLTVARRTGRPPFTDSDLAMAAGFASQASVALELADSRSNWERLALLEDRERIARDLHDHVIQDLFAIGLSLEAVIAKLGPEEATAQRLKERVEDIDRTIRRIRTSIFALRGSLDLLAGGLRQQVLDVAEDLRPALGFAPAVSFSGLVDLGTSPDLADDVVAAAREALTNVAKHARATTASVAVEMTAGKVRVTVIDDGVGVRRTSRSSGIANLRARAQARGGTFTLAPATSGGTVAMWTAATT